MFKKLIPPERYWHCNFDNYNADSDYPSQLEAKQRLIIFAKNKNQSKWINFFKWKRCEGFYLDGSFGVGKTHLLASIFHAFRSPKKLYMSFTELMALISLHGIKKLTKELEYIELICIDEFELDDPANTMKASNFIRLAFQRNISVVTTSNTVADDLGKGSFGYKNFKSEIGFISSRFTQIKIDGFDYRKVKKTNIYEIKEMQHNLGYRKKITFEQLKKGLKRVHFLNYKKYVRCRKTWVISDVDVFENHDDSIRFTYFIDVIYNSNIELNILFKRKNRTIFTEEFLSGSHQNKYKRCLSRLHVLTQK